jgi:hypothetical protein
LSFTALTPMFVWDHRYFIMVDTPAIKSVRKAQICYDFDLDQQDFEALIRAQELRLISYEEWVGICLVPAVALGRQGIPGVQSVDYSVQSGPTISVLIDIEFATESTLNEISKVIDERVSRSRLLVGHGVS